jgi:dihydrodipicolinate synthase/N-acetylneuraminate lyase
MPLMPKHSLPAGVWSATPTPFTATFDLDVDSVPRLVAHHLRLGVSGLMLAGTCGEGAWMRDRDRERLTRTAVAAAGGRLHIALQVTDNSAIRTLDNIDRAAAWGAGLAVVEAPYFFFNDSPARLVAYYREIARRSVLPIGFYDRERAYSIPHANLPELLAEPNVVMIKDSSSSPERRRLYLLARQRRPDLLLLSGDEFDCVSYLRAGYDGLLLGGGIFNGALARRIIAAVRADDDAQALALQQRMNDLMLRVYGGPKIECWLAGLKELLVQLGIFSTHANLLDYPLTEHCRAQIRAAVTGTDGLGFGADLRGETPAVLQRDAAPERVEVSLPNFQATTPLVVPRPLA